MGKGKKSGSEAETTPLASSINIGIRACIEGALEVFKIAYSFSAMNVSTVDMDISRVHFIE